MARVAGARAVKDGEIFNPYPLFIKGRRKGYIPVPHYILAAPVSWTAKILYGRLVFYAGNDGEAFPKQEKLAEDLNTSERQIRRATKELINAELLKTEPRPKKLNAYRYVFIWRELEEFTGQNVRKMKDKLPDETSASRDGKNGTNGPQEPDETSSSTGQNVRSLLLKEDLKEDIKDSSPIPAKRVKKVKPSSSLKNKPNVWRWWVEVNREAGRPDPTALGPDTKAGKALGGLMSEDELRLIFAAYLKDKDSYLEKQGHALRLLPGRVDAYRQKSKSRKMNRDFSYDSSVGEEVRCD